MLMDMKKRIMHGRGFSFALPFIANAIAFLTFTAVDVRGLRFTVNSS